MAHIKTGIDYYAHTVGMTRDRRLRTMRRRFGSAGIDVWFTLLDMIYSDKGYYLDFSGDERENTLMDIAQEVSGKGAPDEDEIAVMIQAFADVGLLDGALFERGVLSSAEIQEQYYMSTLKRAHVDVDENVWMLSFEQMNKLSSKSVLLSDEKSKSSVKPLVSRQIDSLNPQSDVRLPQSKVKKSKVKESREKAEKSKEKAEESKVNAPACESSCAPAEGLADTSDSLPANALSFDEGTDSGEDIPECEPACEELDYTQYSSYVIDDENGVPQPYVPAREPADMQDMPVYGVDIPFPDEPPEDFGGYELPPEDAYDLTSEQYDPDDYDFSLQELAERSPVGAAVARMLSHCNIVTEDGRSIPVTEYQPQRGGRPVPPKPMPAKQQPSGFVETPPDLQRRAALTRTAMNGGVIDVSAEIAKICAEGERNSALFEEKYGSYEEYRRKLDEEALASGDVTIIKVPRPKEPEQLPPQHKALAQRYGENNVQLYLVKYRQWCERNDRPLGDVYAAIEKWMAKDLGRGN